VERFKGEKKGKNERIFPITAPITAAHELEKPRREEE